MSVISQSSSSIGTHNISNSLLSSPTVFSTNNHAGQPFELSSSWISTRTTNFVMGIEKKVFENVGILDIKALKEVIWLVGKQGVEPIKSALLKKSGFFVRFFSNESWEEWSDHRTPLGRVVSRYCDYITSPTQTNPFMERLNKNVLEIANHEAATILKSLRAEKEPPSSVEQTVRSLSVKTIPSVFNCDLLNGKNGFILDGEENGCVSLTGTSVNAAGDVNGDGIDDFIVGAPNYSLETTCNSGRSYVIFGQNTSWSSPLSLANLNHVNGSHGFMLDGLQGELSGSAVGCAGDINNDGIDDLVIGAPGVTVGSTKGIGKAYVIFGHRGSWNSTIQLFDLNGTDGFTLYSGTENFLGTSVSRAGDINGDGIDDLLIGDPYAKEAPSGWSFVLFGNKNKWNSSIQLSKLDGTNGFIMYGENPDDRCGQSVSGLGDFNGDGIDDLIVGAPYAQNYMKQKEGRAYVLFGNKSKWSSDIKLSDLKGTNGFIIEGGECDDCGPQKLGMSVSHAGDINGDGLADYIVGSPGFSIGDGYGSAYVGFGCNNSCWSDSTDDNGFYIESPESYQIGHSVNAAGDVNGDGIDDLIIGTIKNSFQIDPGRSYVIYGKTGTWDWFFELKRINGANGFVLSSDSTTDGFGASVSGVGDVNNDGIDDLIVGAPGSIFGGRCYVVFGEKTLPDMTTRNLIIGFSVGGGILGIVFTSFVIYQYRKRSIRVRGEPGETRRLIDPSEHT